jgi:hypothetical protein
MFVPVARVAFRDSPMPFATLSNRMRARPRQNPGKSAGRPRHHVASPAERAEQLFLTHDYFGASAAGERLTA